MYSFFSFVNRMKYINRWSLMKNSETENLAMHSQQVAIIAHALCVIGNVYFGKNLDAGKAAAMALYHDSAEVMTGDMPTPIKYSNEEIKIAYKAIERASEEKIRMMLPQELRQTYLPLISGDDSYEHRLVKQADKLSAYLKCIDERKSGNREFLKAEKSIKAELVALVGDELEYFMEHFLAAYELSLDEI
ncbi:MAG: 5'-deoxynucleotidase [Clostridia bacterium]